MSRTTASGIAVVIVGMLASGMLGAAETVTEIAPPATEAPPPADESGTYLVNPGDVLNILVWKEQELQAQVVVRPDGFFSFPLTGDIRAQGNTVEQIRVELTERVGRYVPDPVVSVSIFQPLGSKVYIIGQVNRPGEFPANRYVDVVQALSMAGGMTPFAQVDSIRVLRRDGATQTAIPFAYSEVAAGRRLQQNIVLRPGDTVLVP
jgi:polysaccharide export outer membrane protein